MLHLLSMHVLLWDGVLLLAHEGKGGFKSRWEAGDSVVTVLCSESSRELSSGLQCQPLCSIRGRCVRDHYNRTETGEAVDGGEGFGCLLILRAVAGGLC